MAARGMLANPAMFAGYQNTPEQCVKDWVSHIFKKKKNFFFSRTLSLCRYWKESPYILCTDFISHKISISAIPSAVFQLTSWCHSIRTFYLFMQLLCWWGLAYINITLWRQVLPCKETTYQGDAWRFWYRQLMIACRHIYKHE